MFLFRMLAILIVGFSTLAPARAMAETRIRVLIPRNPFLRPADKALQRVIEQFNRTHPTIRVELQQRGDGHSSLKELVALRMAGVPPEIAAIESSESPALEKLDLARPIQLRALGNQPKLTLPFRQTLPVLVVDQEMRLRAELPPRNPKTWEELLQHSAVLVRLSSRGLSVPLQGPLGLWMLEALVDKPLFGREAGGIRTNAQARPEIDRLQKLTEGAASLLRPEDGWERAIQAFIDRSSPMLITSLDMVPYLKEQAPFRWDFSPLPLPGGGISRIKTGSDLIVTRDSPAIRKFLEYLYAPKQAALWISEGTLLPVTSELVRSEAWTQALAALPHRASYAVLLAEAVKARPRATDPEIVRTRSDWVQALRLLFGESARRLPAESVLSQMDAQALPR